MSNIATATFDELVKEGYLVPAKVFAPLPQYDFEQSGIKSMIVDRYTSLCAGKKAIVFCVSVAHAEATAEAFNNHGIPAATLLAWHSRTERRYILAKIESGEVLVLVNVQSMLEERLPVFDAVIVARPTKSTGLFRRAISASMYPRYCKPMPLHTAEQRRAAIAASDKPEALILDVAENCMRHGFFDL